MSTLQKLINPSIFFVDNSNLRPYGGERPIGFFVLKTENKT